jgi:TolA-binding protein
MIGVDFMKKVITLLAVLALIAAFSVSAFAANVSLDAQQTLENSITTDSNTDEDTIIKSDIKSFKGKFSGLFNQLIQMRVECKNLRSEIKANNQSLKTEWQTLKDSLKDKDKADAKKILTDLKTNIDPFRTQVKALHGDIKTLRTQKAAEWTNFRAAVKARDEAEASTVLNNILSLKSQIIEKQKSILAIKQHILELIKF